MSVSLTTVAHQHCDKSNQRQSNTYQAGHSCLQRLQPARIKNLKCQPSSQFNMTKSKTTIPNAVATSWHYLDTSSATRRCPRMLWRAAVASKIPFRLSLRLGVDAEYKSTSEPDLQRETETGLYQSHRIDDQFVTFVLVTNCHKFECVTEFVSVFFSFLSKTGLVTFWSQISQMVTVSIVTGTNLFLFLFRLKWLGIKQKLKIIPELCSVSCFESALSTSHVQRSTSLMKDFYHRSKRTR